MKLSACMIVKNEEEHLANCLNSLVGIVDELCIVDTGSTDKTLEIIESFKRLNFKKIKVKQEFSKWTETDFSKHRNVSVKLATGDLILIIDADEKLSLDISKEKFKEYLTDICNKRDIHSVSIILRDWRKGVNVMSCANTRIFRPNVKYKGKIHNTAYIEGIPIDKHKSALVNGIFIDHYGYDLSKEKMQDKFERTTNALLDELKSDDPRPSVEFYLCQSYGTHGDDDKSYEWGKKYLEKNLGLEDLNTTIFFTMARICLEKNKIEEAWKYINEGSLVSKNDIDLEVLKSDLFFKEQKFYDMAVASRNYVVFYRELMSKGLTGKFYFTLRKDILGCMFERISLGYLSEALNSASAMILNPDTPKEIIKDFKDNLKTWGVSNLWDVINERIEKSKRPAN